jgi:hypothetical protein
MENAKAIPRKINMQKSEFRWQVTLGLTLLVVSAALYFLHYALFRDPQHIFVYLLGDIAFLPIEVLFVTIIIHQLLSVREKRSQFQKLNMVIGAFFSEVGTQLLRMLGAFNPAMGKIHAELMVSNKWTDDRFAATHKTLNGMDYVLDSHLGDLIQLRDFLTSKRSFMLRLLENPLMLEHTKFTDLLWATFHLTEELENRKDFGSLPPADMAHLSGDMKRAYLALVEEWLDYMQHLRHNYPYLFSLAMRLNPFDPNASAEVTE